MTDRVSDSQPATKGDINELDAKIDKVDTKIDKVRTELKGEINNVRIELKGEIKSVHTKLKGEIDGLRTEVEGVDQRLITVETKVDRLEQGQKKLQTGVSGIFKIVTSIEEQLKEHTTLPARVARLERSVFR